MASSLRPLTILPTGETSPKPSVCFEAPCALAKIGVGFVPVDVGARYQQTRLMICGEAPGENEAREGLPFRPYAASGSLFADACRELNISRADLAITNILSCQAPKNWVEGAPYTPNAIYNCTLHHLFPAIEELQPKAILALGGIAFRSLADHPKGTYGRLDYCQVYAFPGRGAMNHIPIIPCFHPSAMRQGKMELYPVLVRALRRAYAIATGKMEEGKHFFFDLQKAPVRYQTSPSLEDAWGWAKSVDPQLPIVWDCETPRTARESEEDRTSFANRDIDLVQFTQRRGEAIAIPYRDEYIEVIKYILSLPNDKVTHNGWIYDDMVAEANGILINGQRVDAMAAFGFYWSDLPRNLQFAAMMSGFIAPWKHLGDSDKEFYGAADVDATLAEYLSIRGLIERDSSWESFDRDCIQVWPILAGMMKRGIPIDEPRRMELIALIDEEDEKVHLEIQPLVPESVLPMTKADGYKNPPQIGCPDCGEKVRSDHECSLRNSNSDDIDSPTERGLGGQSIHLVRYVDLAAENGLVEREFEIGEGEKCRCPAGRSRSSAAVQKKIAEHGVCAVCANTGIIPAGTKEMRWTYLKEFNPNSWQQVRRLIRALGHPVPKHLKRQDANGEAADTTEQKELERLEAKTKHPVYGKLIKKRQLTKMRGTYAEGWKSWADHRVHTTFTLGQTGTGQTSSKEPNVQNAPKHGKSEFHKRLVDGFMRMQKAEEGHCLINFDFKSFHALTTAHDFNIPDYARLARIDIHSFVACQFLRLPECRGLWERDDQDMKGLFKSLRKRDDFSACRDVPAKQTILGIQFGRGAKSIFMMYREFFDSLSQAQKIWELVYSLFPGMKKGQDRQCEEAAENNRLVNQFGWIRHFWDVRHYNRQKQKWEPGDQAEQAKAFRPASHAFGRFREFLRDLRAKGWDERYQLINQIHDSALFHCPLELKEECLANVKPLMEKPSTILTYPKMGGPFHVEAEAQWGESMADLHS